MKDLKAFGAGFVSTLVFHQGTLAILHAFALTTRSPYLSTPTWPFHIPAFVSLALWGGVWAVALARLVGALKTPSARWTAWITLGALLPSLVAWFVVMPLKGAPLAGGGSPEVLISSLLLNAAWGFGVALLLHVPIPTQAFQR
jgi:hypothetical protein